MLVDVYSCSIFHASHFVCVQQYTQDLQEEFYHRVQSFFWAHSQRGRVGVKTGWERAALGQAEWGRGGKIQQGDGSDIQKSLQSSDLLAFFSAWPPGQPRRHLLLSIRLAGMSSSPPLTPGSPGLLLVPDWGLMYPLHPLLWCPEYMLSVQGSSPYIFFSGVQSLYWFLKKNSYPIINMKTCRCAFNIMLTC